jgi:hypothetical protein
MIFFSPPFYDDNFYPICSTYFMIVTAAGPGPEGDSDVDLSGPGGWATSLTQPEAQWQQAAAGPAAGLWLRHTGAPAAVAGSLSRSAYGEPASGSEESRPPLREKWTRRASSTNGSSSSANWEILILLMKIRFNSG